ncbi:MAG: hypothetical protein ACR2IK_20150 [Chloroflexota bacterium]
MGSTQRSPGADTTSLAPDAGGPGEAPLAYASEALMVIEQGQRSFRTVNPAAERLLRYSREELLRLGPDDVSDPMEAPRLAQVRDFITSHGWWRGEWRLRRGDGTVARTEATVVRLVVGERIFVQGLFRARADGASSGWLGAAMLKAREVQHELNNYLALTAGYAELLADNPRLPSDLQEAAREALAGGLAAVEAGKRLVACFMPEPD